MKDEFEGTITGFVGLKSKMYSLFDVDGEGTKKATGINKNVFKSIRHKKFVDALFNKKIMKLNTKKIQSKFLIIVTCNFCKTSCLFFMTKDTH